MPDETPEPALVGDPDRITAEWISQVLRAGGALPEGRVVLLRGEPIGTGQVGRNVRFRLELEGAGPDTPRSLVGKFISTDPVSRATGITQNNYVREVAFYRDVAHTVGIRTPRCYYAAIEPSTSEFALIFEDLAPAEPGDQIRGCDADTAALALEELAKLHAPRWNDPALAGLEWLTRTGPESGLIVQALYTTLWRGFAERYGEALDAPSLALAERLGGSLAAWMDGAEGPRTLVHGDYRLDNMLFGTEAGGPPLAVVDWQTVGHGHAVADAAYFLGAGLPTEARRAHERDLLREYHQRLCAAGVEDLAWDAGWEQYRRFAFSGVVMAVVASMIVGRSERGDAMFTAMARRHTAHALDLDAVDFLA